MKTKLFLLLLFLGALLLLPFLTRAQSPFFSTMPDGSQMTSISFSG